jgi:hypothetical protein
MTISRRTRSCKALSLWNDHPLPEYSDPDCERLRFAYPVRLARQSGSNRSGLEIILIATKILATQQSDRKPVLLQAAISTCPPIPDGACPLIPDGPVPFAAPQIRKGLGDLSPLPAPLPLPRGDRKGLRTCPRFRRDLTQVESQTSGRYGGKTNGDRSK